MDSGDSNLDSLFNNLSSIYPQDNSMLSSNLFVLFNAFAKVYDNVQMNIQNASNNTYIFSASPSALQDNFGSLINFPMPARLNTINNGSDIYRFTLSAMFQYFLSGATTATMINVLSNVISLLTIDPTTGTYASVTNYSTFDFDATSVELTDRAVQLIGGNYVGPATTGDITILPTGQIYVTAYDDSIKTITFTGTINTGTNYSFIYTRNNSSYVGTNWMNLTNVNAQNVSPMDLSAGYVNTYNNPQFSYWWNNYNYSGQGVSVENYQITPEQSSLVFRLPAKTIQYLSPYTDELILESYGYYNLTGTVFDITAPITTTSPDVLFSDTPINYQTDVSGKSSNYYVRYNENNSGPSVAQSQFVGNLNQYTKTYNSIIFLSPNFGPLDFFEKNSSQQFDINNLFGYGTKHAWINVQNINGSYVLNNANFIPRYYSLHEDIEFFENFESNTLININSIPINGARITEAPGNPIEPKQNCLLLMSTGVSVQTTVSPIITGNILNIQSGINHIEIDFYDALYTGTSTSINITQTGTSQNFQITFGIDTTSPIETYNNLTPYYYSINNSTKNYLTNIPREQDWHRLTFDFGINYSILNLSIDSNNIINNFNIGFSCNLLNPSGIILTSISNDPYNEFSYFDNIQLSYYDSNALLGIYEASVQPNDWEGSMLDQSTIIDNKFFNLDPSPSFQFLVTILGMNEEFIYIVNNIINRVKPAYTLAVPIYVLNQELDTTSQVPEVSNTGTNFETGYFENISIVPIVAPSGIDLPGAIVISGIGA